MIIRILCRDLNIVVHCNTSKAMSERETETQVLIPEEDLLTFFRIDGLRKKVATDQDQDEVEESEMVHQIKCEIINEEWQEEKETLLKKIETLDPGE